MAKLKIWTKEDTGKVRFDTLHDGEVFVHNNEIYIKVNSYYNPINTVRLSDGLAHGIDNDALVTYVRRAELNLTI